jgi:hypothetical protein
LPNCAQVSKSRGLAADKHHSVNRAGTAEQFAGGTGRRRPFVLASGSDE